MTPSLCKNLGKSFLSNSVSIIKILYLAEVEQLMDFARVLFRVLPPQLLYQIYRNLQLRALLHWNPIHGALFAGAVVVKLSGYAFQAEYVSARRQFAGLRHEGEADGAGG